MAHTYTCLHYHCIFSTHGRRNLIPQDNLADLHAYLGGAIRNLGGVALAVGGPTNHAHVLAGLPATLTVAEALGKTKAGTTLWAKQTHPAMGDFAWQDGYAAFTVSRSRLEDTCAYVRNQAAHHREMSFEEEFLALLSHHGIEYDDRFVFD